MLLQTYGLLHRLPLPCCCCCTDCTAAAPAVTPAAAAGLLNLIDLAGSERLSRSAVTGDRLKETQVGAAGWDLAAGEQVVPGCVESLGMRVLCHGAWNYVPGDSHGRASRRMQSCAMG